MMFERCAVDEEQRLRIGSPLQEESMLASHKPPRYWLVAFAMVTVVSLGSAKTTELNPAAIAYKLPDQIKWTDDPIGSKHAVLLGEPDKPGLYVVLVKWTAHHMSHPHFHPNDRFLTVLSGTWWVGTGTKFDPDSTVPLPAGTFVTHFGKQVHYDGAKDGDVMLEVVGEGPATATPAEEK
jgi:hypothetical protein